MRKHYCYHCEKNQAITVVSTAEVFNVKGVKIKAEIQLAKCAICDEEIWDESIERSNDKIVFDHYRKKQGLLLPEEIKKIRESYGLSQVSLARLLGFGDKTITRYENGSIQNVTHDNLIRLIRHEKIFLLLYHERKHQMNIKMTNKIQKLVEGISRPLFPSDIEYQKPDESYDHFSIKGGENHGRKSNEAEALCCQ